MVCLARFGVPFYSQQKLGNTSEENNQVFIRFLCVLSAYDCTSVPYSIGISYLAIFLVHGNTFKTESSQIFKIVPIDKSVHTLSSCACHTVAAYW